MSEPDDRTRLEEEGIPDLQDGTPEQQWASDPQEAPSVGQEEPVAADEHGTTVDEQLTGESLDDRLSRERPDAAADPQEEEHEPTRVRVEPADMIGEEGGSEEAAGRLVEQDQGAEPDAEKETTAEDVGVDGGGFGPEERAMRTEPEDEV